MFSAIELDKKIGSIANKVFEECPELQRTQFTETLVKLGVLYGMAAHSEAAIAFLTTGDRNEPR